MDTVYSVKDFDGTTADTFAPGPKKIGVNEACAYAIEALFGQRGTERYERLGGLNNRSPGGLIQAMLRDSNREVFIGSALKYFNAHKQELESYVALDKGYPLVWNADEDLTGIITEIFVRVKLSMLVDQIGTILPNGKKWPEPCKGIPQYFEAIKKANARNPNSVQTAIISSGHDFFIEKTFRMWGIPQPDIILTDDTMRRLQFEQKGEPAKYMKPNPYLLEIVAGKFAEKNGVIPNKEHMFFFGDDILKDGSLAKSYGIPFGLFDPGVPVLTMTSSGFTFNDWSRIKHIVSRKFSVTV